MSGIYKRQSGQNGLSIQQRPVVISIDTLRVEGFTGSDARNICTYMQEGLNKIFESGINSSISEGYSHQERPLSGVITVNANSTAEQIGNSIAESLSKILIESTR